MIEDSRLRIFKEVASRGNFTVAAKALGISQPAVSQNIAELEKALGTSLLLRNRGAVTLTAAGLSFLEYVDKILYWYSAAESLFGAGDSLPKRTVRIAADAFSAGYVLPPAIRRIFAIGESLAVDVSVLGREEADITLSCRQAAAELSLSDSALVAKTFDAVCLTSDERLARVTDFSSLPEGMRFALWTPCRDVLSKEAASVPAGVVPPKSRAGKNVTPSAHPSLASVILSSTALVSDSPDLISRLVRESPGVIGILPAPAVSSEGLKVIPVSIPSLRFDIIVQAKESFHHTELLKLLRMSL